MQKPNKPISFLTPQMDDSVQTTNDDYHKDINCVKMPLGKRCRCSRDQSSTEIKSSKCKRIYRNTYEYCKSPFLVMSRIRDKGSAWI